MTPRTVSLLLLSVAALAMSALSVGALQRFALGGTLASPWMVPIMAALCYTATLFAGRRYILPRDLAASVGPSILLVAAMTSASLLFVYGVVWTTGRWVGGVPSGVVLALWFFALWSALGTLHRMVGKSRLR
jgi:hypothetical protein